jgi:hypothetical protein
MYAQNFVFRLIFGIFAFLVLRFVAIASSPMEPSCVQIALAATIGDHLCASNQRRSTCRFTWHTLADISLDSIWGLYLQDQY